MKSRSLVRVENVGNNVLERTMPPEYCCRFASAGFHGPSFGSQVSTWLGAPLSVMKMHALAVPRGLTPAEVTAAPPRRAAARKAALNPPNRSLRREIKCSGLQQPLWV